MTNTPSRRTFLFYGGAALAGVTLGQFGRQQLAHADDHAVMWRAATSERWAVSVCRECPAACGTRVRVVNGTPVKLDGNPRCPIARGRLCAKGQAAVEALLDPDRLIGPARRAGARGEGRWESISWDTATGLLAARLRDGAGHPGQILAVSAEERGPVAEAWSTFWTAAGARLEWTPTATASQLRDRFAAIMGVAADPQFDVEHATYVLSAGAPLVETWLSPLWAQRAYGRFRRGNGRARGRLVQLDGRRSMTARKADEWIVVDADRQAALVYGLMAVLLRESRIDRTAFNGLAGNLDELERGVVARFTPDEVASATGVPVVTILRLARDLVSTERPLVIVGADADPALVDAVLALNSLIGAFDRPGGIFAALPPVESTTNSPPIGATPAGAPPRLVALRDSSALRTLSTMVRTEAAVRGADFVVSFSPFLDESAEAADLLMPVHTALESWHAVVPAPAVPGQAIALAAPVIEPRLNTKDLMAMLKIIATTAGGDLPAACPWDSTQDLATTALGHLANAHRGGPYATSYESDWIQQLERGGWWTSSVASRDEFAGAVLSAGGWADPFFEPGQIRRALRDRGGPRFAPPLATAPAAPTAAKRSTPFPLTLRAFTPAVVNLAGSPNQPVLFELLGQPEGAPWKRWVEVHPETAREAGLSAGSGVRIESAHGSVEASVVLVDGMPRDMVALAFVPSVPHGGRWAHMVTGDMRGLWPAGVDPSVAVAVRVGRA
jgi:anaerobic selenocysteine-containing dehydrogenase